MNLYRIAGLTGATAMLAAGLVACNWQSACAATYPTPKKPTGPASPFYRSTTPPGTPTKTVTVPKTFPGPAYGAVPVGSQPVIGNPPGYPNPAPGFGWVAVYANENSASRGCAPVDYVQRPLGSVRVR